MTLRYQQIVQSSENIILKRVCDLKMILKRSSTREVGMSKTILYKCPHKVTKVGWAERGLYKRIGFEESEKSMKGATRKTWKYLEDEERKLWRGKVERDPVELGALGKLTQKSRIYKTGDDEEA